MTKRIRSMWCYNADIYFIMNKTKYAISTQKAYYVIKIQNIISGHFYIHNILCLSSQIMMQLKRKKAFSFKINSIKI